MRRYQIGEIFGSDYFRFLGSGEFKPVAWCYVELNEPERSSLLVGERYKRDDPERTGQLAVPGGGVEKGESYFDASVRELEEETGVRTVGIGERRLLKYEGDLIIKPRGEVVGIVEPASGRNPTIWIVYTGNGKRYRCEPIDPYILDVSKPRNQEASDLRNPGFMPMGEVFARREQFTPAVQILLELVIAKETGTGLSDERDFKVEYNPEELARYLRVKEPTIND